VLPAEVDRQAERGGEREDDRDERRVAPQGGAAGHDREPGDDETGEDDRVTQARRVRPRDERDAETCLGSDEQGEAGEERDPSPRDEDERRTGCADERGGLGEVAVGHVSAPSGNAAPLPAAKSEPG